MIEFLLKFAIIVIFLYVCYRLIKRKIKNTLGPIVSNLSSLVALKGMVKEDNTPKSVSSMEPFELNKLKKDFSNFNIQQFKRMLEAKLIQILSKDIGNNKIENCSDKVHKWINSNPDKVYKNIKIHKTVLNRYQKSMNSATMYFQTSLEYTDENGELIQDRFEIEYVYNIDKNTVSKTKKVVEINCPNCGAPVKSLQHESCAYCGAGLVDIIERVWILNNIKSI